MADSASRTDDYRALAAWQWQDGQGTTLRGRLRPAAGQGAPSVHWLSGNGFCGGVYWPFLRRLNADWGVMTHDIAGHGESGAARDFDGVATTLARVREVFAAQSLPRPRIAMGHSFGAALSLRAVARGMIDVDALVLLDPIMLPRRYWISTKIAAGIGRHPFAEGARRRRAVWASAEDARERLRDRGIYKGWSEEALEAFVAHATRDTAEGRALACDPELEAQIFENPLYLWRDIAKLRVPTLMLYGADSYFFMAPSAQRAQQINPRFTAQAMPGGHCFMLEEPDAVAVAVEEWAAGTGATGAG